MYPLLATSNDNVIVGEVVGRKRSAYVYQPLEPYGLQEDLHFVVQLHAWITNLRDGAGDEITIVLLGHAPYPQKRP